MAISHLLPCTLLHPLMTPLMIGRPLMLICHLISCHSTGRLCMLYAATPDRLYMLPLPTDFTCCLSRQTLHAATSNRLYILPLPTYFTCCHSRQTLYLPAPSLAHCLLKAIMRCHSTGMCNHSCELDNIVWINV